MEEIFLKEKESGIDRMPGAVWGALLATWFISSNNPS